MRLLVLLVAAGIVAAFGLADSGRSAPRGTASCRALAASFRLVPGSAGAGNVVYRLTVRNRGRLVCSFSGLSRAELRDAWGDTLPTHARLTALSPRVLAPGRSVSADVRFSPDVPGVGEPAAGRLCEPVASYLDLWGGGLRLLARVQPATSVCERGALPFSRWR